MATTGAWNDNESLEKLAERAEKALLHSNWQELLKMPATIIERCWQVLKKEPTN